MAKTEDLIEGTHYEVGGSVITDYDNEHFNDATLPWKFNDDGSLRGGYDDESPYVYLGEHGPDRYGFFLVLQDSTTKVAKIHCGCRQFTYAQAMRHWKGGITAVHNDPAWPGVQRPHHLALVKCAREIAKINGWKF